MTESPASLVAFQRLFLQALRAKPHPCRILIKPEPSA